LQIGREDVVRVTERAYLDLIERAWNLDARLTGQTGIIIPEEPMSTPQSSFPFRTSSEGGYEARALGFPIFTPIRLRS
jgi:hypothetical protein